MASQSRFANRSDWLAPSWDGRFGDFVEHLKSEGLSEGRVRTLRLGARHFLLWLDRQGIPVEAVDHGVLCGFRRHDCHCPGMTEQHRLRVSSGKRGFMTGALRLVRFLEEEGQIEHPGEMAHNLGYLDGFLARCAEKGYGPDALASYRSACRHVLIWLHQSRLSIRDVGAETLDRFRDHDCVCPGPFERPRPRKSGASYLYPFTMFMRYLVETGVMPAPVVPAEDPNIACFALWLRQHRGIGARTIGRYRRTVGPLMAELGPDPRLYDAARIRDVLLGQFADASWYQARWLATVMRMYLRFLAAEGACSPALIAAVPTAPVWRLAPLPRHVSADAIERVIAGCDVAAPAGLRDRAILLLLSRLALRAGDIVELRLDDIDWHNALVQVCGKSRREIRLPLPQDAGDAVLAYIERARPRVAADRVFLRTRAPYRPFASSNTITSLVIQALKRAGMEDVRPRGAYLFRHSAATHLLRSGVSIEVICTLLRHRSVDTSLIYAKTDRPMLLEVAQPWPGEAS